MNQFETKQIPQGEMQLLQKNANLIKQQSLIMNLLSMEDAKNDALTEFNRLVHEDFWQLSAKLGQPTARQDYLTLSAITQELQLMIGLPDIKTKSIVGVCGGFSSGKSALINSFIELPKVRLTEGVNPVTAVASYVTHRSTLQMRAYSKQGSSCALTQEHYEQLDHEAQKDSPIDLQRLLSCVTIGVPMMHKEIFSELCMIDTPGYNPMSIGTKMADHKTAHKFAKQSDALIWVVSAEQGTLPQSDLDFIDDIKNNGFSGKLYIVINKADLKSESDRQDVLQEVMDKLDFECVDYEGISLYSSSRKEELGYYQKSLTEFLASCRTPKSISDAINEKINDIFDAYQKLIEEKEVWMINLKKQFKSLEIDIMQGGGTEAWDMTKSRIENIFEQLEIRLSLDGFILKQQLEALRLALISNVYQIENDLKSS